MNSSEDCFPFDGKCELSKDADFTLTFDDGSCLKSSKIFLELASPVLKTAIGECQHEGTLHLSRTSKDTWILILNYIHPAGRSVSLADFIADCCFTSKTEVLRQCEKFGFAPLKEDIDGRIARAIDAMNPIYSSRPSSDEYKYAFMECDLGMFAAVKEYELPRTEEAVVAYLMKVIKANQDCLIRRVEVGYKPDNDGAYSAMGRIARVLAEMHDAGRYRMGSLLAQVTLKRGLLLSHVVSKK